MTNIIKRLMVADGLTVDMLSSKSGIPKGTLYKRISDPSSLRLCEIWKLASALNVSAHALINEVKE